MIIEILTGIVWFLVGCAVMILILLLLVTFCEEPKVKCPRCGNKQRDSTYRKQRCDMCCKEWFDAYDD